MDLDTRLLQQKLTEVSQLPEVLILKPVTTSTNDDVREVALKGINSVLICSRKQTQGRGQQKRQWVSPEGNIYLSTLLNVQNPIDGRLALEVALNITQMPSLEGLNLNVKWPNDLYFNHKKLGGILIEPISATQAVVGVGINLAPIQDDAIKHSTTSLQEIGLHHIDRISLIAELYLAIQQAGQWFDHHCYNLGARFNHHAAFMNQQVVLEHQNGQVKGLFLGIQDDGSIQIQTQNGLEVFYQGRLRLSQPSEE